MAGNEGDDREDLPSLGSNTGQVTGGRSSGSDVSDSEPQADSGQRAPVSHQDDSVSSDELIASGSSVESPRGSRVEGGGSSVDLGADQESVRRETKLEKEEGEEVAENDMGGGAVRVLPLSGTMRVEEAIPTLEGIIDGFSDKYQSFLTAHPSAEGANEMQEQIDAVKENLLQLMGEHEGEEETHAALTALYARLEEVEAQRLSTQQPSSVAGGEVREGEAEDLPDGPAVGGAAAAAQEIGEEVVEHVPNPLDLLMDDHLLAQAMFGGGWQPAPVDEEFECLICMDTIPPEDGFRLHCMHKYCKECLGAYFRSRIEGGLVLVIPCPHLSCGEACVESDIRQLVDADDFARFRQFHYLAAKRSEPTCRWCPKADCGTAILGDPADLDFPRLTCVKCETQFCYECNAEWHEGMTCKENHTRMRKDGTLSKKNENWKRKHKTRKCAQCRVDIFKDKGCNHMICTSCGYQFCWICMQPFTPDHYIMGNCAGLQFSSHPKAKRRAKRGLRICRMASCCLLLTCCLVFVVLPLGLLGLVFIVLPVLIICLIIGLPIYLIVRCCRCIRARQGRQAEPDDALAHSHAMV